MNPATLAKSFASQPPGCRFGLRRDGQLLSLCARMKKESVVSQAVAQTGNFAKLFAAEQQWRHSQGETDPACGASERFRGEPQVTAGDLTEGPRVTFAKKAGSGLAFSGGGIRSATFNLGILRGLHRLKLLAHFDYLSTVSGGGY